jgi:hypothetical protein
MVASAGEIRSVATVLRPEGTRRGCRLDAPGHGRKELVERKWLGHSDVGQRLHAVRRRGVGREVATADENRQPRR